MSLPPGPRAPTLLQTWQWLRRPTALLDRCAERYGAIFSLSIIGLGPMVMVAAPEDVRRLFAAGPELVCQPRNARFLAALGPSSLLLLNGEEHLWHRRMIMPALRVQNNPRWRQVLAVLRERSIDSWPLGTPFSMLAALQDLTRSSMMHLLLGTEADAPRNALIELCAAAIAVLEEPGMVLPLSVQQRLGAASPWTRALRLLKKGDRILYSTIARRRARKDPEGRKDERNDVLAQLLAARDEDGRRLSDSEVRDELFTLLVAGHDTTAIALCWTLHELFSAPALLGELYREVRASFCGGAVEPEYLDRMPLLDAVLRESLRLWPVFPILSRQLLAPMRLSGYELPPGTRVVLCPYLAHRRPESFVQPQRFLPQRFLGAHAKPSGATYFPFGGGLRRCVGVDFALYEMKMILGTILARAALRPAASRSTGTPMRPAWRFFSLAPSDGLPVVLSERQRGDSPPAMTRCAESGKVV